MSAQLPLPEYDPSAGYLLGPALSVSLVRDGSGCLGPSWDGPTKAAAELLARIPDDGRERFGCVFLNVRNAPTAIYTVTVGCLTATLVHPRAVFGPAIVACAAAVILWHNHPSGDAEPSQEDIALTRRLAAGGTLLGVNVADHLILGQGTRAWVSLKQRGIL